MLITLGSTKIRKLFFFDGGFVGPALVYKVPKSDITFCYSEVTASQKIHEKKRTMDCY